MTLLFADGFEDGTNVWSLSGTSIGTGRYGSGMTVASSAGTASMSFGATVGPLVFGFAFKPTTAATRLFAVFGGSASPFVLDRGVTGELTVSGSAGTSITGGISAVGVVPSNAWSYVEVKFLIHATTGYVTVRVNGVTVISATGDTVPTGATTADQIRLGGVGAAGTGSWDDFYMCDTTGSVNNDFLGDLTVEHLRPAADDTAQWLGSDANSVDNWALVDEAGTYNGADYVASSTIGQRDLYTPAASARAITSPVLGVVVAAVAMKTDAGTRTVKLDVKEGSGGTVRQGTEQGLPTTFGELRQVFERKGDGSQFTVADVNALRMGIEVVT